MKRHAVRGFCVVAAAFLLAGGAVVSAQLSPEDALAKMKAKEESRRASTQASPDDLAVVRAVNKELRQENTSLKTENSTLRAENDKLRADNDKLKKDLAEAKRLANGGEPGSKGIFEGLDKETKKK